jgi:3'-phosphoadenosine 5'-phosphosulfate sulfotransferase (PAPS reductase)/FAD synthetase
MYHIASVSWGKDSLAMLLELIERGEPLNEVVFYDTEMEFEAVYTMRDRALPLLAAGGIKYTELKPDAPFLYKMFDKPVNGRNGQHCGYSWCGGRCRWGTTEKLKSLDKYAEARGAVMYVGIAADETPRIAKERKPYKVLPLVDWGITEPEALARCYASGFDWPEGGHRLYELLDRVSCWCCANKNLRELKNIYKHLPQYWQRLRDLQSRTSRPMKGTGKSVFELEARFAREIESGG